MGYGARFTQRTGAATWRGAAVGTGTRATSDTKSGRAVHGEAGFTLVEALVAIVVLIFGLMAVTNLMLVAASSNSVANQGTAAVTSAIRVMDMIKATGFTLLPTGGGDFDASDASSAKLCSDTTLALNAFHCNDDVPGVGAIHTHWSIESVDGRLLYVRVHSEGSGALTGARSRAEFTTFRACTNSDAASGGQCPPAP
jgi:type II secretory pathway pseudopilin PulG